MILRRRFFFVGRSPIFMPLNLSDVTTVGFFAADSAALGALASAFPLFFCCIAIAGECALNRPMFGAARKPRATLTSSSTVSNTNMAARARSQTSDEGARSVGKGTSGTAGGYET